MCKLIFASVLSAVIVCARESPTAPPITIRTAHHSAAELATEAKLQRLLADYDLKAWTFTREILIDERAIPHSHPVLTLHTRHLNHDDELLSAYLHEQLHWFLSRQESDTDAAVRELMRLYPEVPVGFPQGAQDRESTYEHLLVCRLERQADLKLLGPERTERVMQISAKDHYTWIYETVLRDGPQIDAILKQHHLDSPQA